MTDLPDRPAPVRAVVTGAAGLVGAACVRALHGAGCAVTLVGRRRDAMQRLCDELGPVSAMRVADLADPAAVDRLVDALRPQLAGQRLVLVNAAGVHGPLAPVTAVDAAAWDRTVQVNLTALVRLVTALAPAMRPAGWGRVVQIGSAAALDRPGPFNSAYSVSKAAANRFLGHLAAELDGSGVTVHAVHPGELASDMHHDIAAQAAGDPALAGFAQWAAHTARQPDDPRVVGRWVAGLLDDVRAARLHGSFAWAQQQERAPVPLA